MDYAIAGTSSKVHEACSNSKVLPAHYAVQTITTEIFTWLEKKLDIIASESIEKQLNKSIRRGDDSYFGNLLRALSGVCETCLPSILKVMIMWYEHQQRVSITEIGDARDRAIKRTLAASYLFCIVLIEILPQLHFHPCGCDEQINFIIDNSFKQISYRDPALFGNNYDNSLLVAELFAEVIGILSQSHSKQIQKTFFDHLNEYRKDALTSSIALRSIISLLMGTKFFRVQTNQVSEFEIGVGFLNELGSYFLEVDLKQKDLKHALAGLLVEILLPMTAQIRTETNIPSLISFVDKLYGPTYELVNKKQHKMASYPLLTCLLCISQSKFFLSTWVQFLNLTLANLKNKDSMVSRMALESLYRLIWVYIIRISCEGNTATRSRLESICGSLFPRGSRNLVPRDAPLNFFVKIIHFIAQFKVDFAFKEIIFDLIGCARAASRQLAIYPERMNVGLRALMVIADGLQQKESPPGMSRSLAPNTSGTIHRTKRNYITKPLSMDVARAIGLEQYYPHCRKAFDAILRTLDGQIGRPLMMTAPQMRGKEYNDLIGADMKAKLDLFRTCIAAIPRLLPDPMSHQDLIDFLTRMCIHVDEELRTTAYQSLQNLVTECPEWREDIIHNFIRFFISSIQDTFPALIESMVRLLLQLLTVWKANILMEQQRKKVEESTQNLSDNFTKHYPSASESTAQTNPSMAEKATPSQQKLVMQAAANIIATSTSSTGNTTSSCSDGSPQIIRSIISSLSFADNINPTFVLHCVEGLGIALLCQTRLSTKKAVIQLLREVKQLIELFKPSNHEMAVIDILDSATPYVLDKYVVHLPALEKKKWPKDFASVCERISMLETDANLVNVANGNEYMQWDPWACALSGYCEKKFLPTQCSTASTFAWPILFLRFSHCNQFVDPSNPQNESRSSLLRSSKSKAANFTLCGEMLSQENYLSLWQKYLVVTFALCHCNSNSNLLPNSLNQFRSLSPCLTVDSSDVNRSMISSIKVTRTASTNFVHLMQKATTMIRWEATDVRDSVVLGIGSINPECFEFLLEEFNSKGILREINDRKNETNVRRRKRKDLLRLQILRIIEFTLFRDFLKNCAIFERNSGTLPQSLLELFDSIRFHTENDNDRDLNVLTSLRLHFAKLISLIINGTPIEQREKLLPPDIKRSLFFLFLSWCGRTIGTIDKRKGVDVGISVEHHAIRAMCALATLGPMFECPGRICEEEAMFRWLETLLSSTNSIVDEICEQILCHILHLNEHNPRLLELVVQMCYTKNDLVGIRCFNAISMLFSQREFPCEYISLLCLCQSFASSIELASVRQTAFLLVQLLRHQFLNNTFSPTTLTPIMEISSSFATNGQSEITFPTNQFGISKSLSSQYPQLTMPIFSEICCRLESARPNRQLSLLAILPEWLRNVHFVDPNCDLVSVSVLETDDEAEKSGTSAEEEQSVALNGWGSEESTQLILNNLLYLTAKLANECNSEVESIWHCVATSWPSNLCIIVHYLFVTLTLSVDNILPLAKKICVYLLNATGDRLVSLLMAQLQRVGDPFMAQLCRSEIPPFYRWQPNVSVSKERTVDAEECGEIGRTIFSDNNVSGHSTLLPSSADRSRLPNQLPMPPYGGYYCRLSTLLPSSQSISTLPRNNLALFLLSDLLLVGPTSPAVDWPAYHPKLLHMATINLDSHRPIVCAHVRQLLLNICLYWASSGSCSINQVANAILKHCHSPNCNGQINSNEQQCQNAMANNVMTTPIKWGNANAKNLTVKGEARTMSMVFPSKKELLTVLVQLFSSDQQIPLWEHEEVSPLCWKPDSVNQLECLVRLLVAYLLGSIPDLVLHWTNFAVDFAISSNNLHLAGRSFQTAGALGLSPSPFLHQILSRLTEMVGDVSEESQSYITDLFMCLQNLAQNITIAAHLANSPQLQSSSISTGHNRSVSYTQQISTQNLQFKSPSRRVTQKKGSDMRHSLLVGAEILFPIKSDAKPLTRSQSAATLKFSEDSANILLTENDMEIISQLLFIALAMTESNLENEFLLGLSFVDKLLLISGKERLNILEKLEELIVQHGWDDFPGIIAHCLKGTLYSSGSECAISVFCNCLPHLSEQMIVSKQPNDAFALIVIASLPQFVLNFDLPTQLCSNLAQKIILYCQNRISTDELDVSSGDHPICNLITIMDQFRDHSFPREKTQWTKCVVNYLIDALQPNPLQLLLFLAEMLENCSVSFHSVLLDVMHLLFTYANYNESPPEMINSQVIRVILKHIHGPNGREASKILKIVTDQWNSISYNYLIQNEKNATALRKPEFELHFERTFAKESAEMGTAKNERLMKNRVRDRLISVLSASGHRARSPKHSSMLFSHSSSDIHQRVRETTVLAAKSSAICQNGASMLPSPDSADTAHPSAWSQQQPSDEMGVSGGIGFDRMSSPNSLMSAVVGGNNSGANSGGELASLRTTDSFPRVFKEFDFLEAEHDSVSESTESCFNWLSTMRTARCGVCREDTDGQNGTNQDQEEDVPDEDDFYIDEEEDEMDHQSALAANRTCIGNFGSSPRTMTGSRHSMGSNNGKSCRNGVAMGGGEKKGTANAGGTVIKRPPSKMSDSNDVSSDTTPVQLSRHSDEEEEEDEDEEAERDSVSSCPLSEKESSEEEINDNLASHNRKTDRKGDSSTGQIHSEKNASPISQTNLATTSFTRSPSTATSSTHRQRHNKRQWQKRHKKATSPSASPHNQQQQKPHSLPHTMSNVSAADSAVSAVSSSQHYHLSERNNDETGTSSPVMNFRTVSLSTPERMSITSTTGGGAFASLFPIQQRLHSVADAQPQQPQERVEEVVAVAHDNDVTVTPLECSHHISGSVEQTWNKLVASLGNDNDGTVTSSLMLLFTQLLRESVVHLSSIFRDASHLLLSTETPLLQMPNKGGISTQLSHSLNVVLRLADCPFLFVTPLFLRSSNLLTCQKFALFEIREHFDTFAERRSQAIRALNSVKSSLKLLIISNNGGSGAPVFGEGNRINSSAHNQQFDYCSQQTVFLCKSLHRLSFQLLLLLEKLLEMTHFILQCSNSQDYDMTPAVTSLQRDLLTHQATFALDELCSVDGASALSHPHQHHHHHHQQSPHSADGTIRSLNSLCSAGGGVVDLRQSRDTLVLHLNNKQFKNAFNKLSFLRSHYCSSANGQFGCCEQMNVDVLLLHFCRSHFSLRMWALVGSLEMLRCWCTQLKEANVQLGILVRNMMLAGQPTTSNEFRLQQQQQSMGEQNDDEREEIGGVKKASVDGKGRAGLYD